MAVANALQVNIKARCGCAMSDGTWQTYADIMNTSHIAVTSHSLSLSTRATSKGGEGGRVKAQMYLRHISGSVQIKDVLLWLAIASCLTRRVSRLSA